ncbi:MAG: hypothetical protein ACPMAQ_14225, partial [Phycisphaerae bacterium]
GGGPAEPIATRSREPTLPECGWGWAEPGAQIAGLGDIPIATTSAVWRIDHVLWNSDALAPDQSAALDTDASLSGPPRVYICADAWWRRSRSRYDFIVQTADGLRPADIPSRLSWEWFEGLRRHLLPRGAVLVELPVEYLDTPGACSVVRTFGAVFASYDRWFLVAGPEGAPRAYLLAMADSRGRAAAREAQSPQSPPEAPIACRRRPMNDAAFLQAPLNMLRRPAFRALAEPRTPRTDAIEHLWTAVPARSHVAR